MHARGTTCRKRTRPLQGAYAPSGNLCANVGGQTAPDGTPPDRERLRAPRRCQRKRRIPGEVAVDRPGRFGRVLPLGKKELRRTSRNPPSRLRHSLLFSSCGGGPSGPPAVATTTQLPNPPRRALPALHNFTAEKTLHEANPLREALTTSEVREVRAKAHNGEGGNAG
jgi:hypothetical protein